MPRPLNRDSSSRPSLARLSENDELDALQRSIGRGWQSYEYEAPLEPAFPAIPSAPGPRRPIDDGRIPSRTGRHLYRPANIVERNNKEVLPPAAAPAPVAKRSEMLASVRAHLPAQIKIQTGEIERLLSTLANAADFISFETIGTADETVFQITSGQQDRDAVMSQLRGHFPQIDFRPTEDLFVDAGLVEIDPCFRVKKFKPNNMRLRFFPMKKNRRC